MATECEVGTQPPDTKVIMPTPVSIYDKLQRLGGDLNEINRVKRKYPVKISSYYLNLIQEKDDPIWKQCVPSEEELEDNLNIEDPLKEEEHTPVPYLVHKYKDRVLLLVSSTCEMYCRFCTRKRKVGKITQIPMAEILKAIDYIKEHTEVRDVVVSGGDPLTRTDAELKIILTELRAIPHLDIIRIGSRIPCVNPARITKKLVNILREFHPLYMNIHFNHPMEVTPEVSRACLDLANAGIVLGSQTVLLAGVNDSPEVMKELMRKLVQIRVKPYYIYQCDLVKGAEHFRTEIEMGIEIIRKLQGFTSGLCLPHYVIDGPGGKVPVSPLYVKDITPEQVITTNYLDQLHVYPGVRQKQTKPIINKTISRIGIAFNLHKQVEKGERTDKYAEFDDISTINAIRQVMQNQGYEVFLFEADEMFIEKLKKDKVDFVFNIAEGIRGESRESHVPAILEMMNIPYSGSGVLSQAVALNKSRKKEILSYYNIPTPKHQLFKRNVEKLRPDLTFPLIVKPDAEGSSIGITNDAVVYDVEALKKQVNYVLKNYKQNALVEEYCEGLEFTVSILGNNKPRVLPIVEINFSHLPYNLNKIDSWEAKWIYDRPDSPVDALICPANIKPKLKVLIEKIAKQAFGVLECKDFSRIDMRLDANGIPQVLDVNTLPGLTPDYKYNSRFIRSCYTAGMTYDQIIMEILNNALKRYNLYLPKLKDIS